MSLPEFNLPDCLVNKEGWGPNPVKDSPVLNEFEGLPYQHFNKCDRIGRIVDWLGVDRYKKSEMRKRPELFERFNFIKFEVIATMSACMARQPPLVLNSTTFTTMRTQTSNWSTPAVPKSRRRRSSANSNSFDSKFKVFH